MRLEELKRTYETIQKKHNLPRFEEMNADFDIGKIKKDSGSLLRDIRRMMNDKLSYYMRLIEVMINPSQAPPTFLMLLKEINKDDKKILDSVFTTFIGIEIEAYKMNISSTEGQEAEFISKIYKVWNDNKEELVKILNILERNWKQINKTPKQNKDYFN